MKKSKRRLTSLIVTVCMGLTVSPVNADFEDVIYEKATKVNEKEVTIAIEILNQTTVTLGAMPEILPFTGENAALQ